MIFYTSFLNLFLIVLGLRCCAGFSLAVESRSYSLVVVCRLLIKVASLVVGSRGARPSVVAARGLSSWGSWALECKLNSCGTGA